MDFILQHYSNVMANGGSSQGIWIEKTLDNPFITHCLEDERRDVLVLKETRIQAGFYPLKIWNDGKNPNQWVLDHRAKYNLNGEEWFKFPIEIANVPGRSGILIHAGIDQTHTDGCPLLCDTMGNNTIDPANQGARSLQAVKRFYKYVYPYLEKGGKSFLEVRDESFLIR